ncbi:MAG: LVIVD repeat-containing protein, partial [Balneolaceae bacterium]
VIAEDGTVMADTVYFFLQSRRNRRALGVSQEGTLIAYKPGTYGVTARTFGEERLQYDFDVTIAFPAVADVQIDGIKNTVYAETSIPLIPVIIDESGAIRDNVEYTFSTSKEDVAMIDAFNNLKLLKKGKSTITLSADGIETEIEVDVKENPVESLDLIHNYTEKTIRTGDVITFEATPKDRRGRVVEDVPVSYSYIVQPDDNLGQGASALIEQDGKFVANHTGVYTVMARSGSVFAETTFRVVYRNVQRPLEVVGKGIVPDVKTSDLWVWEGVDGRDYAVTGTWGARGEAFFWDVTDPTNIHTIDTVQVDARTVNDVKVSEDGTIAVITREGASNRKNGIIILDVTNPRDVKILSEYTEGLTGGVHNAFIYEDHVYAVNNGRKYDIINIEDPTNPRTVSVVELDTPGHAIHDVWIQDGIAYSSNWGDGVVAMDIGSNESADMPGSGGSPENPKFLGSYTYPSGWNHAAFPFKSKSTGDFYIAAGDEAFPYGLNFEGPNRAAGWVHFVKFDGWDNPDEVARYKVPEAGSHNYWIEDDILYAAFYNGGLRIVDISGELMGDLYDQDREIAMFLPMDENAAIPNAAFTWGPQPYKGLIFLSDWNSGIWAVKLGESTASGTN